MVFKMPVPLLVNTNRADNNPGKGAQTWSSLIYLKKRETRSVDEKMLTFQERLIYLESTSKLYSQEKDDHS